jgi:hypothetical protein
MTEVNAMDRLLAAITAGDLGAVRACFTSDAIVWHGYDCLAADVDGFVASIEQVIAAKVDLRYDDVRRYPTSTGFVQQHLLVTPALGGGWTGKPCCVVVHLENGLISQALEYLDRTGTIHSDTLPMTTPGI